MSIKNYATMDFIKVLEPAVLAISEGGNRDATESLLRLVGDPEKVSRAWLPPLSTRQINRFKSTNLKDNLREHRKTLSRLSPGGAIHKLIQDDEVPYVKNYLNNLDLAKRVGGSALLFLVVALYGNEELQEATFGEGSLETWWSERMPEKKHARQMREELIDSGIDQYLREAVAPGEEKKRSRRATLSRVGRTISQMIDRK